MTIKLTHAEASAAILAHVERRALVQGMWHGNGGGNGNEGREIACLLGAMHPKVNSPQDCNGDLMPLWLAELTPVLFDGIPESEIYPIAERYGRLVGRWHVLTDADWRGLLTRFLIRVIDDAVAAARPVAEGKPYWPAVEAARKQSQAAIRSGDKTARADAYAAARAADAAADAAAAYAADAADAAANAAYAADAAADANAADAAYAAARAAADAAAARAADAAADAAAYAAAYAARADAYLTLFRFLLDQIEEQTEQGR